MNELSVGLYSFQEWMIERERIETDQSWRNTNQIEQTLGKDLPLGERPQPHLKKRLGLFSIISNSTSLCIPSTTIFNDRFIQMILVYYESKSLVKWLVFIKHWNNDCGYQFCQMSLNFNILQQAGWVKVSWSGQFQEIPRKIKAIKAGDFCPKSSIFTVR